MTATKTKNGKVDEPTAITAEWIDQQIARRKAELEETYANANHAIGKLQGRIAELEQLKQIVTDYHKGATS